MKPLLYDRHGYNYLKITHLISRAAIFISILLIKETRTQSGLPINYSFSLLVLGPLSYLCYEFHIVAL